MGNETVARDCWSQAVKTDPLNAYVPRLEHPREASA